MKRTVIPAGEWLPDQAPLGNPALTAQNVLPWAVGYKPFPSASIVSGALTARAQGGAFGRDNTGNVSNFAGDATKLYLLDSTGTFNDVTRVSGGSYATANDDWWEFAQWGETIIATNYTDDPQVFTLNSSSNFAALSGSPPKTRHMAVVRDFLVFGNIDDGTAYPSRVRWSGINSSTSWTVSATTQADYQDLVGDGGWVQKVVGGEYGLVFQERAIWRMSYVGSPVIFQFDLVERNRGAYIPQSVIGWGGMVFFIADDGFYAMGLPSQAGTTVSGAQPIGDGKVDRFFLNDLQTAYSYRVSATIDPINKVVMWAYPGSGSTSGIPNKILAYNWVARKWSIIVTDIECFARYAAIGYTTDSLDSLSGSLDALIDSLDSRVYTGGAQTLAGFDSSHKLVTYSGTAMNATVDTGDVELNQGARTQVVETRPLVDGLTASVTPIYRNVLSSAATTGSAVAQNASGVSPVRVNARYTRFRVTTSGAFNFIQGVEATHTPVGGR